MRLVLFGSGLAMAAALIACSDGGKKTASVAPAAPDAAAPAGAAASVAQSEPPTPPIPPPAPAGVTPVAAATPATAASEDPRAQAINTAGLTTKATGAWSPELVRAQVLLSRARFSPGVIDGRDGDNFRNAIGAFEAAHGHAVDGRLSPDLWAALTNADPRPVVTSYVISPADVAGPFSPSVPSDDLRDLSKLKFVGYTSPLEMLAERFRMDKGLLKALNPGVDFSIAGARILVAAFPAQAPPMTVSTIEVDKSVRQVRAFDGGGALLAAYPATVGSTERPAPSGEFKVTGVAQHPTFTYDPRRLTYGDRSLGKLTIKPGPNNPVGVVWIDLNMPTYGIHGAPDQGLVGKTASHGCVRLTNWDAEDLAAGAQPGVKVVFVGAERRAAFSKRHARPGAP